MTRRGSPAACARSASAAIDRFRRVARHLGAAAAAIELRCAREQQLHVIVQFGHGADRGARGAHRVGLVDGDRGRDAVDAVDLRLVHAVEELARIGREGLDVAPLALGVERVEHERTLARSGHAGDHDQLVQRDGEAEVLEVVLARAVDEDGAVLARCGAVCFRHCRILTAAGRSRCALRVFRPRQCNSWRFADRRSRPEPAGRASRRWRLPVNR